MAKSLNAGEGTVYLGPRATESQVKEMDLSDVRVLAFATHGLVAGQLKGVSEPGLAFRRSYVPSRSFRNRSAPT
jgi:hypothetical protein